MGVGLIHKTQDIFFTSFAKEVFTRKVPTSMTNKRIYPTVSLGSRDDEAFINFG
jgi:hypothetical protein